MISRFNGVCRYCGKTTVAGTDPYDPDSRKAFHERCQEAEDAKPDVGQLALAIALGYRTEAEWDWVLLPAAANGDPAWWYSRERIAAVKDETKS